MAFPIPSLPTDNLYKFIALTGFFTFVLSLGFLLTEGAAYETGLKTAQTQLDENEYALDYLNSERNTFTGNAEAMKRFELGKDVTSIIENISRLQSKSRKTNRLIATWFGTIGLCFALLGFSLWYFKVQRYQDKLLKAQATEAILKLNINPDDN